MADKPISGIISESYHYVIDGEFCSGSKEYNVIVTQWWGKGDYHNKAKEVICGNTCFRNSKMKGWRYYDKHSKKFMEKRGIGLNLNFIPNETSNHSSDYNRVNLGTW